MQGGEVGAACSIIEHGHSVVLHDSIWSHCDGLKSADETIASSLCWLWQLREPVGHTVKWKNSSQPPVMFISVIKSKFSTGDGLYAPGKHSPASRRYIIFHVIYHTLYNKLYNIS